MDSACPKKKKKSCSTVLGARGYIL
jgi:hypothetical protein